MSERINVTFGEKLKAKLERSAKAKGLSSGALVRTLVIQYLNKEAKKK